MPDHVHLLLEISLKLSVSYLKGKSALMMFDRHATGLKHFIDIKIQFIALYRLFFCQTFCFLMW